MDKIEYCYKLIDEKQELIRRTDSKASSVIVIVSFASSAFISMLFRIDTTWQRHLAGLLYCVILAALLITDVLFVLMPRLKTKPSKKGPVRLRRPIGKLSKNSRTKNCCMFCLNALQSRIEYSK